MSMTELIDYSRDEYAAFLDREVGGALGMDVKRFLKAYADGELDEADDPEIARLAALLGIGQNGR